MYIYRGARVEHFDRRRCRVDNLFALENRSSVQIAAAGYPLVRFATT